MVTVAGQLVPYDEVNEEMTQKMTPGERDAYIRIGQEMYENMYDWKSHGTSGYSVADLMMDSVKKHYDGKISHNVDS